jgi:quercetin dioxygenase-like cupin family protein
VTRTTLGRTSVLAQRTRAREGGAVLAANLALAGGCRITSSGRSPALEAVPDEGDPRAGGLVTTCQEKIMSAKAHFTSDASGTPTAAGRYVDVDSVNPVEFVPGLQFRPVLGERTMTNFVRLASNTEAPVHVHEEEQIVIVLEGEFEFELDGDVRAMQVGDFADVPPWVPHGARTKDGSCYEVDVFNPPRRALLQRASSQGISDAEAPVGKHQV